MGDHSFEMMERFLTETPNAFSAYMPMLDLRLPLLRRDRAQGVRGAASQRVHEHGQQLLPRHRQHAGPVPREPDARRDRGHQGRRSVPRRLHRAPIPRLARRARGELSAGGGAGAAFGDVRPRGIDRGLPRGTSVRVADALFQALGRAAVLRGVQREPYAPPDDRRYDRVYYRAGAKRQKGANTTSATT